MRNIHRFMLAASTFVAIIALTHPVSAQYSGQSVSFVRRPLNMPAATVRADADLVMVSVPDGAGDRENIFSFYGTVAAAFTDNLELGLMMLPLRLSPDSEYLNPGIYGMYTLLRSPVELAIHGGLTLPVKDGFHISGGVPILIRAGDLLRINTGGWLSAFFAKGNDEDFASFEIPFQLAIQFSPQFFLGPEFGLCFGSAGRPHMTPQTANTCLYSPFGADMDEFAAPLGVFGGYTFVRDSGSPLADWRFGFRSLDIGDGFERWAIFTAANFFFYL